MNFPPLPVQVFRRWLLATGWIAVLGARAGLAQTPKSEGSDSRPSVYTHPLRTWVQTESRRNEGKIRDLRMSTLDAIQGKLQSIVIPRIEFRRTTLADAIEFLRQESRRLDPEPDPEACGVNIFVKLPAPPPPARSVASLIPGFPLASIPSTGSATSTALPGQTTVTLKLDKTPLLEVLKAVAGQVGMRVEIEPYAVCVVPLGNGIIGLTTTEYHVPPEAVGLPADFRARAPEDSPSADSRYVAPRMNPVPWLKSRGVDFPSGASATYLSATGKLVVRNTQENLDIIAALLSSALQPADPTTENP